MVKRISALEGRETDVEFGTNGKTLVRLEEIRDLNLHQIALWPDTVTACSALVSSSAGAEQAPTPCRAMVGESGSLLRIEPLKWWLIDGTPPALEPGQGTGLDLSHSRTQVRISGPEAATLLSRLIPIDLSDAGCPVNSVFSTALHHVGITVWRSEAGFEMFIPRGFAVSIFEVLLETAEQFNAG